jgi:hypothetical protein
MIASPRTYFFTGRLLASTQNDGGPLLGVPHPQTIGVEWSIYETELSLDTGK